MSIFKTTARTGEHVMIIHGAEHAPFWTHPQAFLQILDRLI